MRFECYAVKYLKKSLKSVVCYIVFFAITFEQKLLCIQDSQKILKLKNIYNNFKNDSLKTEIVTYDMVSHGKQCWMKMSSCLNISWLSFSVCCKISAWVDCMMQSENSNKQCFVVTIWLWNYEIIRYSKSVCYLSNNIVYIILGWLKILLKSLSSFIDNRAMILRTQTCKLAILD